MHALLLATALMQQVLPGGPVVQGGYADPREPQVAVGFVVSNLFADELESRPGQSPPGGAGSDLHGVVQLGTNFPLIRMGDVTASLQGGVISRFRLEASDNDALSSDFVVALPLNYRHDEWEGRVRIIHRSGHLGDELVLNTSIRRLEFDHEEIDVLIARQLGLLRAYAGGSLTIASSFAHDDYGLQAGLDGRKELGSRWAIAGGADWQRQTLWDGNSQFSLAAGVELRGAGGRASVQARFLTGATPIGEFFLDRESYWGLLLVLGH